MKSTVSSLRCGRVLALMAMFCATAGPVAAALGPGDSGLNLFNGTSLLGWNPHGTWSVAGGAITSTGMGSRNIVTAVPFAEFSLQFEYNASAPMGAKLRVWASRNGDGGFTIDLDNSGAQAGVGGIESVSSSSMKTIPGGWHRVGVEAAHGQVSVRVDGLPSGTASGVGSRAGYVGFEASGSGTLQVRNIRLTPANPSIVFRGGDLSGWKSIARNPTAKGGVGHTVEKTLTFGIGGGSTKPHEAKWTVAGSAIHGQDGPGGLENANVAEDAVIQLTAAVKGDAKKDNFTAVLLRNTPGQLSGGYSVGIGPYAGGIDRLENHAVGAAGRAVDETIVIGGRTIAVWVNDTLAAVHTDSRPEGSDSAQGARTAAGAITLLLPNGGEQLDVTRFNLTPLPKAYGLTAKAPPPAMPVAQTVAQATTASATVPTAPSVAETALLQQQQNAAKKDAADQQNKQRIAALMSQALSTTDPNQQMAAYGQVVQIDPSNAAAVQGYKEAQQAAQAQQGAMAKASSSAESQKHDAETREEQTNASLAQAQSAFIGGHLGAASSALSVAERLSPGNPLVRDLRARIGAAQSLRSRLFYLGGGVGLLALAGGIAAWMRRRKMERYPVLAVTSGLDSGDTLPLDKDLVRIGAVPQYGGQKNDIVIRDVEHAVSRFHCEIVKKDGQLYINDLNSSNGTRVDGNSIKPGTLERLRKGSRITLANTVELRLGYDRGPRSRTPL